MFRRWIVFAFLIAVLALAALACDMPGGGGGYNETTATALAQTAAALIATSAGTATPTPPTAAQTTPTPTLTPMASNTSEVAPGPSVTPCNNVSKAGDDTDVTVPDNTHFAPGTKFVKTWRLKNTGTCAWNNTYTWRYISGEQMGAPASVSVPGDVPPGATVDISVSFIAPSGAGTYKGTWQMYAPDGTAFGSHPWVQIIVP